MNRNELTARTRSITRDFNGAVFRTSDVEAYLNEAIDRFKQVLPQLKTMKHLESGIDIPSMIPEMYQHLLAIYSASRCFDQDDRHYQASTRMNEFEVKLAELKMRLETGELEIVDPVTGLPILLPYVEDYVRDNYFEKRNGRIDNDLGVNGL